MLDRVNQCAHCGELHLSKGLAAFCSDACADVHKAAQPDKAEVKAEQQRQRRKKLSSALAARKGICLCCGAEFDLKRSSGKTCSDRCRQKLARGGQMHFVHRVDTLKGEAVEMLEQRDDLGSMRMLLDDWCHQNRNRAMAHAPALVLWIDKQPAPFQRKVWGLGDKEARETLGPKLITTIRASR